MILTVTVLKTAAPQNVNSLDGTVNVQPGESVTAEFTEAEEAYIRACPGHFRVGSAEAAKAAVSPSAEPARPAEPAKQPQVQHRRRGRGRH